MFHNVLRVVHDVLLHFMMYHNVLQVLHDVLQVFNIVLRCLVSHATIGIAASATEWPQIASGIATMSQGSAITPQKLAMMPQGSSLSPLK